MTLSNGFPEPGSLENDNLVEQLRQRIQHLELLNEKLLEEKVETDRDLLSMQERME